LSNLQVKKKKNGGFIDFVREVNTVSSIPFLTSVEKASEL